MKKILTRIVTVVLTMAALLSVYCISAGAAGAQISFSNHSNVLVGKPVTVTMTVTGAAGYDVWLSYNSSLLKYTGDDGRVSGGGGSLHIIDFDLSGKAEKLTIELPFETLAAGTSKITVTQQTLSDDGADTITDVACGQSTITVYNPPTYSSDSSLKSLSISPGVLSPQFSTGNTNYSVTVASDVTKLAVDAKANHDKAKVEVFWNNNLQVGTNWVSVVVTAENGSQTTYGIKVVRNASVVNPPPTPTPVVTPTPYNPKAYVILPDGSNALVSDTIDEDLIPAGFTLDQITLDGVDVPAVVYDEDGAPAVYLAGGGSVKAGFYFVNVEDGTAVPMETVAGGGKLILVDAALAEIPEGYELGKFEIGGAERDALVPVGAEEPNHCLVYAINSAGVAGTYQYDPMEETYQRFGFAVAGGSEDTPDPTPTPTQDPDAAAKPTPSTPSSGSEGSFFTGKVAGYIFLAMAAVAVILLVLFICFASMYTNKKRECKKLAIRCREQDERERALVEDDTFAGIYGISFDEAETDEK